MQDFPLDFSHQAHPYFPLLSFPFQVKLRVLLLQLAQLGQCGVGVGAFRQRQPEAEYRLQAGRGSVHGGAQSLSGIALAQAGYGSNGAGRGFFHRLIFCAVVQPYLGNFFPIGQRHADFQHAAKHLQVG